MLPKDSILYYIGYNLIFGQECKKISDGRTKMQVKVDDKLWNVYYYNLRIEPLTEQEKKDHRLGIELSGFFNRIISK